MKKIILLAICFFIINNIFAQNNLSVIYKKKTDSINIKDPKLKEYQSFNNKLSLLFDKLEYHLIIHKNNSIFKNIEDLNSELRFEKFISLAISMANGGGKTYCETNGLKLVQKEAYGANFIIKSNLNDYKWNITKETKKINDILCFKANTTIVVENRRGKLNKPVIAWFTPSITNNFGPAGYGGLPGLILELKEGKITYYATSINYNPKNMVIKKPTKGKMINMEDFNAIGKEMFENRKR